ncbi:replication initiation protein RepC [Chachezhania sediminis]|uniref:replication initiation protein RepC n=1 Tax=Chachezhania sediminis TaxID=2599291 RepID=UPI002D7EFBFF|nr:replication initiation protein RepC [Chachezhania sediminis]
MSGHGRPHRSCPAPQAVRSRSGGDPRRIDRNPEPRQRPSGRTGDSCRAVLDYHDGPIRHWHQLFDAAAVVGPAMGITRSAWKEAQNAMGPEQAAVVVAAMLERFAEIRNPGGFLSALSAKATAGAFSCGPVILALRNREVAT